MRYEVREETDEKGKSLKPQQWVIWDTLESRVVARFGNPDKPNEIVRTYQAAQMAAEASAE